MEVRGFCPTCRQWQNCRTWGDHGETRPYCPVCHTAPSAVGTHGAAAVERGVRQAEGYCSRCEHWFACDTWFELDHPLPTCPHCGTTPARLNYETAHGWRTLSPGAPGVE